MQKFLEFKVFRISKCGNFSNLTLSKLQKTQILEIKIFGISTFGSNWTISEISQFKNIGIGKNFLFSKKLDRNK